MFGSRRIEGADFYLLPPRNKVKSMMQRAISPRVLTGDKLLYMDADCTVIRPIQILFDLIQEPALYGFTEGTRLRDSNPAFVSLLKPEERDDRFGINSGILGGYASYWREVGPKWADLCRLETGIGEDQAALHRLWIDRIIELKAYPKEWIDYPTVPNLRSSEAIVKHWFHSSVEVQRRHYEEKVSRL